LARIITSLGGRAAEQVVFGNPEVTTGASNDLQQVTNLARQMVTRFGMSSIGPIALEDENPNQVFLGAGLAQGTEYAENIANPSVLASAVNQIGHKHVSLNIQPAQYLLVGNHLIASIKEVLGDAATPEIIDAWEVAYSQLAELMSGHEASLYKKQVAQPHGWIGWRSFKVGKKVSESIEITSFYLYPIDGEKVPPHIPGQYISAQLFLPGLHLKQARQYSISSVPNDEYYRISVKREKGVDIDADGLISNYFHDFIKEGDLIMVHDYSDDLDTFKNEINGKIWNWCEITENDILPAIEKNNLKSFNENNFKQAAWVCKIK
jgi:hypothetical protein